MNTDIANWCRYCTGCQAAKVSRHNRPVFRKFEEPTERFDHVHVDLVRPLPYSEGFRYLLTCVDRFTRWPGAIPIQDIRAETVADAFFGGWVARFGTPATITTDSGAQFESRLWDTLCNQFGITRNRTTSYHPQSNGKVECFHRQLKSHYGARNTEPVDNYASGLFTRHPISRQGNVRQIGRRDGIRNDITSTR